MRARDVTVVAGVSGCGKSTFCIRYLLNAPLSCRFLFDPYPGEFNQQCGEFADRLKLTTATDLYSLNLSLCKGWVAFDPQTLVPEELQAAFVFFCDWSLHMSQRLPGQKVIVVDEAWEYTSPHFIPVEMARIVRGGSKAGLRMLINTQEPHRLNDSIMNGVSEFVTFKLESDKQLDCVEKKGFDRQEVRSLQPLQFISRNIDSGGTLRGKIAL
jgi:hypothetical protein